MLIFKKVADLNHFLSRLREKGKVIGFVPTMGALHTGHISLIERAQKEVDHCVVSIFVNPTQFNDPSDLDKYPRPFSSDVNKLAAAGTSILFHPANEEIYPPGLDTEVKLEFGELTQVMEGVFRPGHFEGMANVVSRLLDIVEPDILFMGLKDFQQLSIVRSMIQQQNRKLKLVGCPIIRETDGLAMSSRNARLKPEMRAIAPQIHQSLIWVSKQIGKMPPKEIEEKALMKLEKAGLRPEYISLVDGQSLSAVSEPEAHQSVIVCAAVWAGNVRLIDNLILKGEQIIQGDTLKTVLNA